ncbi:MAG: hypothetical protein II662_07680, partial [Bacteroidales bacterium]|nr:hypothetical protein [Bacteroidales bacterium]
MRKLLYAFLAFILLMSCEKVDNVQTVLRQAEALVEINSDSALLLLETIDTSMLSAEDSAHYVVIRELAENRSASIVDNDMQRRADVAEKTALWIQNYDAEHHRRYTSELYIIMSVVIGVFAVALLMGWWYYRRKVRQFNSIISENTSRIVEYRKEILRLEINGDEHEFQIAELKRKINERQEKMAAKIHIGTKLYERMRAGDSIADVPAADLQCLVEYFALLRPRQWYEWEQRYDMLTPRQIAFLILCDDLHYDDEQIGDIMGIKNTAIRSIKSRIRKRE